MALRAIKRFPAEFLVAEQLRAQITGGDILPGARLVETALSEELGVSRGTLRVALHALRKEGLVVLTPYTGWSVATIAPEDLWELYTLRAGLESMAVRLACEQLDEAGSRELGASYGALLTACEGGRYTAIAEKDFELHKKIVELARHNRLAEHYRMVEQQIRIFVATTYHFVSAPASVIEHHEPIVAATLARDADLAAKLISEHATSEGRKLYDYLLNRERDAAAQ